MAAVPGVAVAAVTDPRLRELSGLTASIRHPHTLWGHQDSGDTARIFAISTQSARVRAEIKVKNVRALDWECIGAGRTSGGLPVVYVGDVGDNGRNRPSVQVHQILEPSQSDQTVSVRKTFTIRYEDGPRDCEALVADRRPGGGLWLIEKLARDTGNAGIYRVPYGGGVARRVGECRVWVTDACLSPDGHLFIVRAGNKASIYDWQRFGSPTDFDLPRQVQGEAVTFNRDGTALYLGSEYGGSLLRILASDLPKPKA